MRFPRELIAPVLLIALCVIAATLFGCEEPFYHSQDAGVQVVAVLSRWDPTSESAAELAKRIGENPWEQEGESNQPIDPQIQEDSVVLDPWGTQLQFSVLANGTLEVRSWGADMVQYTRDDIVAQRDSDGHTSLDCERYSSIGD